MAKSRVTMQPTRAREVSTQSVQMLNPDAWREGKNSYQQGYNSKWRKARATFLARCPLCVRCEAAGRVTAANEVDHIQPHRGDMKLFWDSSNWQALCKSCHSRKTALEDGGIGHARRG